MNMRNTMIGKAVVTTLLLGAWLTAESRAMSPLRSQLAPLAEKIAQAMKDHGHDTLALGAFRSPDQWVVQAGPGISQSFADELLSRHVKLSPDAPLRLQGAYKSVTNDSGNWTGVRIEAELVDEARSLGAFTVDLLFVGNETTTEADGSRALAPLLGLTAVLPPDGSLKARQQLCHEGTVKPRVYLEGTRLSAAEDSPYHLEVLIANQSRKPVVRGGLAYVELQRGERYAVRLTNQSERPVAVTLTIDGLSMFAFSERKDYSYVILSPQQSAEIQGWHRTNDESDAFEVTSYSQSAAAKLLPESPKLGGITATFAACWPKNMRPPADERFARLAVSRGEKLGTGRGPLVRAGYEEVEMHMGAVRAAVSVRYTRLEP